MAGALDASDYIFQGCWINWSKGRIIGSTLTLSPGNSTLLTNMLALFVSMAGGQFWIILRFALHQVRVSAEDSDRQLNLRYNKEQVVLRNTTSAITSAQLLLSMRWAARRDSSQPSPRTMPVVLLAILSAVFFLAAGAFSNTLTDAGPYVLSRSPFCGFWNQTYVDIAMNGLEAATGSLQNLILANEANAKKYSNLDLSLQYALGCYLGQSTESSNCDTFQVSALKLAVLNDTECPFKAEVCNPGADTIVFDTGLVDTHTDLGINAAKSDRLSFRRVTKCTILDNTKLTTDWINQSTYTEDETQPTWQIAYADFGPSLTFSGRDELNETYSYSNFRDFYTPFAADWLDSYHLGYDYACATGSNDGQCSSTFEPIQELEQSILDADLILVYLGYDGSYIGQVDDPWFSAHQPFHLNTTTPFLETTYTRDKPIGTMGCTEQHQICARPGQCTPLLGYVQVQEYLYANIRLTPFQNITLDRLMNAANEASMFQIIDTFTSVTTPLLADGKTVTETHTMSMPLPDDQWKQELGYWQRISLAQLQRSFIQYGTGQIAAQTQYLLPPINEPERWICQNLMIRSTVYQSFSVLALSLITVIGLLVIILSFTIEQVSAWLCRRLGRWDAAGEAWKDHDMLGDQTWRTRVTQLDTGCQPTTALQSQKAMLPSYSEAVVSAPASGGQNACRRSSPRIFSLEDRKKLRSARVYDTWI